ncbi:YciI family protein [Amycolatopsis thermoflava]|uniref:YciI family protein n=1 Tax=Amycolatopsis thermoflava TaxID=84480 RepID=UPI003EBE89D7
MKFLVLIYRNAASQAVWESLADDEKRQGLTAYEALDRDLAESGELVTSASLAPPETGKRVLVSDGQVVAGDGPFAEVKEQLAGFYVLDCGSLERAVEWAARIPEAGLGLVEVRPTQDLSVFLP